VDPVALDVAAASAFVPEEPAFMFLMASDITPRAISSVLVRVAGETEVTIPTELDEEP